MHRTQRLAIVIHRWLGVSLCGLFLLWFPSGLVMMYWDFPSVTPAQRFEKSERLRAATISVTPEQAFATVRQSAPAAAVRLTVFDGRPIYRFQLGRSDWAVYADSGEPRTAISRAAMDRAAQRWSGQAAAEAAVEPIDIDQWTVQGSFRSMRPLWKYSWPNGDAVYVSAVTGDVEQFTTTRSRLAAYAGAIPHWLYFTPLRRHQAAWSRVVVATSALAAAAALIGLGVGVWRYSPAKRYRRDGAATAIPYRGPHRWHMVLGLLFGAAAVTWPFSGMLSMDPFRRGTDTSASGPRTTAAVAAALRAAPSMPAFAAKPPAAALAQLGDADVTELELRSFAGSPVYVATLRGGRTRIVPIDGEPLDVFDPEQITRVVAAAVPIAGPVRAVDRYDRYYRDRRAARPLPVLLVQLDDADHTRLYIDLRTATIAGSYGSSGWVSRWLYHGLHSLDFPWLYDHRPLWDAVVITFMAGGTALAVTSWLLAWHAVGRMLRRPAARSRADEGLA